MRTATDGCLLGAPLGSHWLGGAGPFSAQGAVFAGLFLLLAVIGWLSARLASAPAALATGPTAAPATGPASRTAAMKGDGKPGAAAAALARALPYTSVVVAAFVPLAAGLYLATTTAWTLGERALARRLRPARRPARAAIDRRGPAG